MDWPSIFRGWRQTSSNPADVDSKGGRLKTGQHTASPQTSEKALILKRYPYVGDPAFLAQPPRMFEVQDENGTPMFWIDWNGGFEVDHVTTYDPPPDGVLMGHQIWSSISDDGSAAEYYALGLAAVLFGASLYGMVGRPWVANKAVPYSALWQPSTPSGYVFVAKNAGTSGATEPAWNNSFGATTVDNDITWYCFGQTAANTPFTFYGPHNNDGVTVALNKARIFEIWKEQTGSRPSWSIGPSGEEQLWVTPVPADADVATSQRTQYYDDTVGAPHLWIKQRDSAGTLYLKIAAALDSDGSLDMKGLPVKNSLLSWPLAPSTNQTIPAGHGAIVDRAYKIAGGITSIGAGGKLRIL